MEDPIDKGSLHLSRHLKLLLILQTVEPMFGKHPLSLCNECLHPLKLRLCHHETTRCYKSIWNRVCSFLPFLLPPCAEAGRMLPSSFIAQPPEFWENKEPFFKKSSSLWCCIIVSEMDKMPFYQKPEGMDTCFHYVSTQLKVSPVNQKVGSHQLSNVQVHSSEILSLQSCYKVNTCCWRSIAFQAH